MTNRRAVAREKERERYIWDERKREKDGGMRREQQIEQKPSETGRFVVARQWLEGIIHRCNRLRAPAQRSKLAWTGLGNALRITIF